MRRRVALVPIVLLLLPFVMSGVVMDVDAQAPLQKSIAVSVPSLAGIVQGIGGFQYNITVLVNQDADPHTVDMSPEIIATADDADLLVLTGHFQWEIDLAELTSTPFIAFHLNDSLANFEDYGAEYSPMPGGASEEGEHEHEGNPHGFWLLPKNALAIANATRMALTMLNSTMSGEWNNNFEAFSESLQELEDLIESLDAIYEFSDMHAVVVAPAEAYVAEAFGITSDAVLQIGEISLSGAKLIEVQQAIRNGTISLIIGSDIAQFLTGGQFAYQLQRDYGGTLIWWKTVFFEKSDYFWMMNYNLGALVSGLEGRSGESIDNTLNVGLVFLSSVLGVMVAIESVLLIIRARAE